MSQRRKFNDYEKRNVYAKCDGTCAICGKHISFNKMTIDHIIPLSKGGTNELKNLQATCRTCNMMKSDLTESEFYQEIKHIIKNYRIKKMKSLLIGGIMR